MNQHADHILRPTPNGQQRDPFHPPVPPKERLWHCRCGHEYGTGLSTAQAQQAHSEHLATVVDAVA